MMTGARGVLAAMRLCEKTTLFGFEHPYSSDRLPSGPTRTTTTKEQRNATQQRAPSYHYYDTVPNKIHDLSCTDLYIHDIVCRHPHRLNYYDGNDDVNATKPAPASCRLRSDRQKDAKTNKASSDNDKHHSSHHGTANPPSQYEQSLEAKDDKTQSSSRKSHKPNSHDTTAAAGGPSAAGATTEKTISVLSVRAHVMVQGRGAPVGHTPAAPTPVSSKLRRVAPDSSPDVPPSTVEPATTARHRRPLPEKGSERDAGGSAGESSPTTPPKQQRPQQQ